MTEKLSTEAVFADIEANYAHIEQTLAAAAAASGRKREDVRFMAVTKTVQPVFINHALSLGIGLIGENKVQELLEKKEYLTGSYEAHLIGHLQTNKVKKILNEVSMIESVDSLRLAEEISRQTATAGKAMDILLEVNIGSEESKTGILPQELPALAGQIAALPGVQVRGLMAVPPVADTEKERRAWFAAVREQYESLRQSPGLNAMDVLSMGMSADYGEAVAEGATLVRVGSALFGSRRY